MLYLSAFYRIHHKQLPSTNVFANSILAKSNPINGTVISTYNQTNGSGQIGRSWFSDIGKNITTSLIIYPHIVPIDKQFYLSMAIALAVRRSIASMLSIPVYVKWPNDIYVKESKIAGLLLQPAIQGNLMKSAILGIGLNVNQSTFPSAIPNPISLKILCKKDCNLEKIWEVIEINFRIYYNLLINCDYQKIHNEYERYLYRKFEDSTLVSRTGVKHLGKIEGVNEKGQLKFTENGVVYFYNFHEVRMLED